MADGESKKTSGTCVRCQRPTTLTCGGCRKAPLYDECFIEPTFYCNSECLKAGWAQHKSKCKKLQARKSLARAAMVLQAIMYRIRLHASTLRFKSLRLEGSTIFLDGYHFAESEQLLKPFPIPLNGDRSLAEAVLVYMGCSEAMRYLYRFAKELFNELSDKIEEITVTVIDQKLHIYPVFPDGQWIASSNTVYHNLYKVELKNGEVWAVDTTGAQHGYPDPLSPWPGFEQRRSCKFFSDNVFGGIRHEVEEYLKNFPVRRMVAQMFEKRELCDAIEEEVPALVQAWGGKLNVILKGSDAAFEKAKDKFLDQLEDHITASMTKLYTPYQIARRNMSIDAQLSLNMANCVG